LNAEVSEFVRQYVRFRDYVEVSELFMGFVNIEGQSIFSGDFEGLRKMVDFLKLIETLVKIWFTTGACPQHVPVMAIRMYKAVVLEH
jgi:hypothetical protein